MAGGRRGLGDVLHYFISEEEQAEARRQAGTERAAAPMCWSLPASPDRPLACALAVDLAAALTRAGSPTEILAPFPAGFLAPRARGVPWRRLDPLNAAASPDRSLRRALESGPVEGCTLLVLPPEELGARLAELPPGTLRGVLVPLDAAAWGLAHALAILRQLAALPSPAPIGVVAIGAASDSDAERSILRVQEAARAEIGAPVESLGQVPRDPASFRSLLRGVSIFDVDAQASSARGLEELCRRLHVG